VSQRQKQATNEKRERRLGSGQGIRSDAPRGGGGVPVWGWIALIVVVAALVGGGVFLLTRSSDSSSSGGTSSSVITDRLATTKPDPISEGTWAPNYDNLSGAIAALNLPGYSEAVEHYHAHLRVIADGNEMAVPSQIGIDQATQTLSPLHTHDDSGVIHIEADQKDFRATLGDVLDIWGVKFTDQCLGGFCDGVKVYVNGKPVSDPVNYKLQSHDAVTVVAGTPPADFKPDESYKFPAGE
jgi:hypothetical protein